MQFLTVVPGLNCLIYSVYTNQLAPKVCKQMQAHFTALCLVFYLDNFLCAFRYGEYKPY